MRFSRAMAACGCVALVLASAKGAAAPMGFKESWMAMGDFSPNWRDLYANYAFTPRDAAGPSVLQMRSDDRMRTRDLTEIAYTRLVKRWNLPNAQANIWFVGGVGELRGNDFPGSRTAVTPGVQVDYETTRVYASASARLYRAGGIRHDFASGRLGFSFFEADYDEIQPWLVVEARRTSGLSDRTEVTPMLRLIHKSYFVEAGVNNMRQLRLNFMHIF